MAYRLASLSIILRDLADIVARMRRRAIRSVRSQLNININERGQFSHLHPSETPEPWFQLYHVVRPGSRWAKCGMNRFRSARLRMRNKNAF